MGGFPRDILLRYRWTEGLGMSDLIVEYVSRGMPGDVATVRGPEIDELGRGHFSMRGTEVPYHRVLRILRGGEVLFDRAALREGR